MYAPVIIKMSKIYQYWFITRHSDKPSNRTVKNKPYSYNIYRLYSFLFITQTDVVCVCLETTGHYNHTDNRIYIYLSIKHTFGDILLARFTILLQIKITLFPISLRRVYARNQNVYGFQCTSMLLTGGGSRDRKRVGGAFRKFRIQAIYRLTLRSGRIKPKRFESKSRQKSVSNCAYTSPT